MEKWKKTEQSNVKNKSTGKEEKCSNGAHIHTRIQKRTLTMGSGWEREIDLMFSLYVQPFDYSVSSCKRFVPNKTNGWKVYDVYMYKRELNCWRFTRAHRHSLAAQSVWKSTHTCRAYVYEWEETLGVCSLGFSFTYFRSI